MTVGKTLNTILAQVTLHTVRVIAMLGGGVTVPTIHFWSTPLNRNWNCRALNPAVTSQK